MNDIFVTTSIPYVNASPHIGFALELVQADVIARYDRLRGKRVRFQTGADENALKNVHAARERGIDTQAFVDENTEAFRKLGHALALSTDDFVRTTGERHRQGVARFWKRLKPDDLYRKNYTGLYCTGCEDFFLEKDLAGGLCPEHGTRPVAVAEENFFFRLSAYERKIEELLASGAIRVIPETRRNEVLSFVRGGLEDISVSRPAARSGSWGIRVPGDESQVIYVWIDALVNYVSGPGFGAPTGFWSENSQKTHVIGKNVWKFHAVYWPALLLSAGLPLPDRIVVHGFLTANGRKIGKSLGNAVDPFRCIDEYGVDAVRYYLLRAVRPFEDGDFSPERLVSLYNSDLANGLGNLLARVTALWQKAGFGSWQRPDDAAPAPEGYAEALENYEFDEALKTLWTAIAAVNHEIEQVAPWNLLKKGDLGLLRERLAAWLERIAFLAHWLSPFLPETAQKIEEVLRHDPLEAPPPLFARLR